MPALGCPVSLAPRKGDERTEDDLSVLEEGKHDEIGEERGCVGQGLVKRRKGEGLCVRPALLCTLFKTWVHFVM